MFPYCLWPLFTGCTQEDVEFATDVLTAVLETESKEEVAEYHHTYGHLPSNFIKKKEAQKLGWVSSEGNLWDVAPGMSIGGDYFGNYESLLPEAEDHYESFELLYGEEER